MPLNKNYTKMLGTDTPSTIDNKNSTQMSEIEADMTTIESHIDDTSTNPHGVDASDVGLGSVDNTADVDKPVSTATQTALDLKADASAVPDELTDLDTTVTGAQLNSLKTKVDGIEAGADVTDATNVNAAGAVMESDLINTSAGAGDASKPVKLDAAGHIDASMVNDGDIDHGAMSGLGDDDHTQYSLADGTRDFTNKVSYDADKTFTGDNEIVTKKYVDDEITGAGGYNDEAAQDAVGGILTDTAEIDFTYDDGVGSITADIKAGSIDETKLDTSTNTSLDLADSALQSSDIGSTVQAQDTHLDSLAGLTPGVEGRMITSDGLGTYQMSTVSGVRSYLNVEDGADVTDATNVNAAGATMNTDTDVSGNSYVLDEDDMTSDSNTKLATQQSIKAYSDAKDDGWIAASNTWSYSSYDSGVRTAVISTASDESGDIQLGDRITFSQTTDGVKYGICTAITSSAITVFMNADYDFDNETITSPKYSHVKNPFGFDANPAKWSILVSDSTTRSQASPTINVWYNLGSVSLDIPIGAWAPSYDAVPYSYRLANSKVQIETTLSTTTSTVTDASMTGILYGGAFTNPAELGGTVSVTRPEVLVLTTKDTYYLLTRVISASMSSLQNLNGTKTLYLKVVCAYL